jgi:predicted transcriptional regulator
MTDITVKALMNPNPKTLKCSSSLEEVVKTLLTENVDELAVVNSQNKLLGFVSALDCHKAILISSYHCDKPVIVNDIMNQKFISINKDEQISDVAIKMQNESSNIYPVIESEKLIGTLSRNDLLKVLNENLSLCSKRE